MITQTFSQTRIYNYFIHNESVCETRTTPVLTVLVLD